MPDQPRPETWGCASALKGKPETGKVAAGINHSQVVGDGPGWQVAGILELKGRPETGINASVICTPANYPVSLCCSLWFLRLAAG